MSYKPRYDKGDWKTVCDVCGRLYKAESLRKRWDGLMVCSEDFETRQPQDFVRGAHDRQIPPWVRSEPADLFVVDSACDVEASAATPGLSKPGCMIPSGVVPAWYAPTPPSSFTATPTKIFQSLMFQANVFQPESLP